VVGFGEEIVAGCPVRPAHSAQFSVLFDPSLNGVRGFHPSVVLASEDENTLRQVKTSCRAFPIISYFVSSDRTSEVAFSLVEAKDSIRFLLAPFTSFSPSTATIGTLASKMSISRDLKLRRHAVTESVQSEMSLFSRRTAKGSAGSIFGVVCEIFANCEI
jgi:hypothetical protein